MKIFNIYLYCRHKKVNLKPSKENICNIPNLISLYRLLSAPVLIYTAYAGFENIFFYWVIFNLITDGADGFIARRFNMKTKIGAKLDSFADFIMYLTVIYGLFMLKWNMLDNYKFSFFLLLFYYVFIDFFALIKFKEISSLHLISSKISGIIQSIFVFTIFVLNFYQFLYWLMFVVSSISFVENIYFLIKLKKMRSDLKGFFWTRL